MKTTISRLSECWLGAVHQWTGAVFSIDTWMLILVLGGIDFAILQLPQRTRSPPTLLINDGINAQYVTSPLLNNRNQNTVSSEALILITFAPIVVAVPLLAFRSHACAKAWLHCYICTQAWETAIVEAIKRYVGYWRPHSMHSCGYNVTEGTCRTPYPDLFASFPSGHSSDSVAAMVNVTLLLLGVFKVGSRPFRLQFDISGNVTPVLDVRAFVISACLLPVAFALWVCASRVHDMEHHPADVVTGAVIGGASAVFWYLVYFPSPFANHSNEPRFA